MCLFLGVGRVRPEDVSGKFRGNSVGRHYGNRRRADSRFRHTACGIPVPALFAGWSEKGIFGYAGNDVFRDRTHRQRQTPEGVPSGKRQTAEGTRQGKNTRRNYGTPAAGGIYRRLCSSEGGGFRGAAKPRTDIHCRVRQTKVRTVRRLPFRISRSAQDKNAAGDILESSVDPKYTISDKLYEGHLRRKREHLEKGNGFGFSLFDADSPYTSTISARYYKDGSEILVDQGKSKNPRKLTPRECARLQGFPENFIIPVSDTQAYKQFGNSVAVPVVGAVAKRIVDTLKTLEILK